MNGAFQLIEWQVEALFTHDAAGRIVRQNEPDGPPAPLYFLGRTAEGNIWRMRQDVPYDLAARLDEISGREPVDVALTEEPRSALTVFELLRTLNPSIVATGGPAFSFGDIPVVADVVVRIDHDTVPTLGHFPWIEAELDDRRPCYAVVREGIAVSLCFSSRRSPRAAEAGVETVAAHRGNGYAAAVTAAWAKAVREEGLTPLYSTSWQNEASRAVARRLGLIQYGTDWSVR
jgi:hypothetical protein